MRGSPGPSASVVLAEFGVSPFTVWRASSAIALLVQTAAAVITLRYVVLPHSTLDRFGKFFSLPMAGLTSAVLIANAAGISEQYAGPVFLSYLLATLTVVAATFLSLLWGALMPGSE